MFGLGLGRLGAVGGSRTLTQRALAILRTYGTDAHLWLPGVGVVNGITAGNFSDTAGTTAAIVDSTAGVGLVVDAGGGTINATQGTTAAKPVLRQSSGRYSWQFDGADFLTLGAIPFTTTDDLCILASCNPTADGTTRRVVGISGSTATIDLCINTSGASQVRWEDDPGAAIFQNGPVVNLFGTWSVVSGVKRGNNKLVRANGVSGVLNTTALGVGTMDQAYIGQGRTFGQFIGNIGPVIAIKGTVSDSDLLTLEKWVGSLSGVTI